MSEEEKGYRIVDKRFTADENEEQSNGEPAADSETENAQQPETVPEQEPEVETKAGEEESLPTADIYSIVKWIIGIMAASAWQYMGLTPNPATGKIEKDLIQARLAIDTVVFLGDKAAPHMEEAERREIRTLINDLQINFVQHSD